MDTLFCPPPVNLKNREGKTPLHKAAEIDHAELTKTLLEHNADVNALMNPEKLPWRRATNLP